MEQKKEKNISPTEKPEASWPELPFDETTNFSILGWVLDKLRRRKGSEKEVNFTLED